MLRQLSVVTTAIAVLSVCASAALAGDAQIVSLSGRGETRAPSARDWQTAFLQQELGAGSFVRTLEYSQMALLLRDRTQLRLNQNSVLQIKALHEQGWPTRLELLQGRSWMQRKGNEARERAERPTVLEIGTPYATAGIRGTDWELQVDEAGSATLTVFSGEAEFHNALGRVGVAAGEQARAEAGKAPVKSLLTQTGNRVQWVTAYRAQPERWLAQASPEARRIGELAAAGLLPEAMARLERDPLASAAHALLLADLLLAQGRAGEARALLEKARRNHPDNGRIVALLARAHLIGGQSEHAGRLLDEARRDRADEIEIWLASGELARHMGEADAAGAAYRQALALHADSAEAWFGLASIESEREHVAFARRYLAEALRRDPMGPGFQGEAGTLETFADRFDAASNAFAAALAERGDDYVALTGLGLLHLKHGDVDAALDAFLKAGTIEARYARAALYTGVAYYRQGQFAAAGEMFERAAELDPRDPLPHLLLALAHGDAARPGEAVAAARAAAGRMPYLKSLNQLQNDQKGSANVGAALAAFGLEEWAKHHAWDAWNPFWAGSHLFLADRLKGSFNKNSELFQGFLSDPTAFGAGNRFSSLLPAPGDYATLAAGTLRQAGQAGIYQLTLNGYRNATLPFAYFFEGDRVAMRPAAEPLNGDFDLFTVGLGAKPSHDLGVFLFANRERFDATLTDSGSGFFGTPQDARAERVDLGFNLKLSPSSQSWFKAGAGHQERRIDGLATDTTAARLYAWAFPLVTFTDTGDYLNRSRVSSSDWQWRHTVDIDAQWQLGLGIEHGRQDVPLFLRQYLPTDAGLFYYGMREHTAHRSTDVHLGNRWRAQPKLLLQFDLSAQQLKKRFAREQFFGVVDLFETPQEQESARKITQLNPRLGFAWQPAGGQTLRLAAQKWRRPAAQNTLSAIDTAGIALDDRLLAVGGSLQRLRAQYEVEFGEKTFLTLYGDRRKIDNLPNPGGTLVSGTTLDTLERLRRLFMQGRGELDLYEGTPDFAAGRIDSAGAVLNRIVNNRLSVSAAYHRQNSSNTANGAALGNELPLLPRHLAQLGAHWVPLPRLRLEAIGSYRSARFADEANANRLASGWNASLRAAWETADKRFAVDLRAENLLSRKAAGLERQPLLGARLTWRL